MIRLFTMLLLSLPVVLDLGQVKCSEGTVFANVSYLNASESPVLINFVRSSCSCVKASWKRCTIEPGATSEVQVGFNPYGLEGEVIRRLALIGEGDQPVGYIEVRAQVINDVEEDGYHVLDGQTKLSMRSVRFGYVPVGLAKDMVVHVTNYSSETIRVASAVSPGLAVIAPEIIPAGEEATFTVLCAPNAVGSMSGTINLCLSNGIFELPVSALAIGEINEDGPSPALWVKPSPVKMTKCIARRGWHTRLDIRNDGDGPLTVYKIEVPESVSIDSHELVLSVNGQHAVKIYSTVSSFTMRIFTDDPLRPCRELSFYE